MSAGPLVSTILSAASLDTEALAALFNRVYADYFVPLHLDAAAVTSLVELQDIDLEHSRVALANGELAGVALLGRRGERGWVGGMGVAPEHRRAGIGRRLMEALIAGARAAGLRELDLEVLEQNAPAIALYVALGFADTRRLEVLGRDPAAAPAAPPASGGVADVEVGECLVEWKRLHPERPPWQRSRCVIERAPGLAAVGVRRDGRLDAAVVYRRTPARSSLLSLGLDAGAPPELLAAPLAVVVERCASFPLVLLNLPERDPGRASLLDLGFTVQLAQREMRLAL
jgi:ribosomal protein S18 acetylase RimI-like enzyme